MVRVTRTNEDGQLIVDEYPTGTGWRFRDNGMYIYEGEEILESYQDGSYGSVTITHDD